eukprot:m.179101 g.179101  ORF g.179101 m.179101 type:complete len:83 (+) comp31956_c0_seq3:29-277(+)
MRQKKQFRTFKKDFLVAEKQKIEHKKQINSSSPQPTTASRKPDVYRHSNYKHKNSSISQNTPQFIIYFLTRANECTNIVENI